MRSLLFLFCGLAFVSHAFPAPLKVVTWNTEWLPGGHPNATAEEKATQMKAAQAIVKALDPDILLCQEVADRQAAEELCSVVPGLRVDVVSAYTTRPQNLVIASKLPADSAWFDVWKPTLGPDDPPRGYAFAALKLPGGGFLLTYSLHQKSNLGGIEATAKVREESAKQFRAHLREMLALYGPRGKCDILVGGDCNSSKENPAFRSDHSLDLIRGDNLQWVFTGLPASKRVTIPGGGKYPPDTFDHIFFSGLKLKSVTVGNAAGVSDHHPVLAIFEL